VKGYRRCFKPFLKDLGDISVQDITVHHLRGFIAGLRDRTTLWEDHPYRETQEGGLSEFTIANYVRHIKRLFNWLEKEGIMDHNPMRRIKFHRPKRRKPKAITFENFKKLLKTTEGESQTDRRDRAIILMLGDTGCRASELCYLQIQDLDFEQARITLNGLPGMGKSESRLAPVTPPTIQALRAWLEVRPSDRGPWVFVGFGCLSKGAFSISGLWQMLKRRARLAGVQGRSNPHAFRHAFAREYLMSGGDLATLSQLMGHGSVEVTKANYAIFNIKELQEKHRRHSPVTRLLGDEDAEESKDDAAKDDGGVAQADGDAEENDDDAVQDGE